MSTTIDQAGTHTLGNRTVRRLGYGAMQLAGPNAFGPPKDRPSRVQYCARRWSLASTTSTPRISTAPTSPTS